MLIEWYNILEYVLLGWYIIDMILSPGSIMYFKLLSSKVTREMASYHSATPYFIEDDPIIRHYEILRKVWLGSVPIKRVCLEYKLSRSSYYEIEDRFVRDGLVGLFPSPGGTVNQAPNLEQFRLSRNHFLEKLVSQNNPKRESYVKETRPITADRSLFVMTAL